MQLTDFGNMCSDIGAQIAQITTQIADLQGQLTQAGTDKAAIQQQLDAANQQLLQLQQQVTQLQQQVADLNTTNGTLTSQVSGMTAELQQAQSDLMIQKNMVAQLQSQLQAAAIAGNGVDAALLDVVTTRRAMTSLLGLHKLPFKTTDNKEVLGVWIDSGGHTAQSNPSTNTTPHGTFTATSGTDTAPARIDFQPGGPWDDIFLYERFALPVRLPRYLANFRTFSMTAADRAVVNCVEWQDEFIWNGKVYNTGLQWNFGAKLFRYFDFTNHAWKASPVPFVELGTAPVSLVSEFILDEAAGTTTHLAVTVNGVRTPINITQPATPKVANNKYTISICQLDSNSKGQPFGINVHDCGTRYLL